MTRRRTRSRGVPGLIVILLHLLVILLAGGTPAAAEVGYDADLEVRVDQLARELWCPVCEGQTAAESNSLVARRMRDTIRSKLLEGESREQILDYFVLLYGEKILAAPRARGIGVLAWVAPPVALLAGGVLAWVFVARRRRAGTAGQPPSETEGLLPGARCRIEEELKRYY